MLNRLSRRILRVLARNLTDIADAIETLLTTDEVIDKDQNATYSSSEPPAHWLAKVRKGAPQLLDGTLVDHDSSPAPGEQDTFKARPVHSSLDRQQDEAEKANAATERIFIGRQRTGVKQRPKQNEVKIPDAAQGTSSSSQIPKNLSVKVPKADNEGRTKCGTPDTVKFVPDNPPRPPDRQDPATQAAASAASMSSPQQPASPRQAITGGRNRSPSTRRNEPGPAPASGNTRRQHSRKTEQPIGSPAKSTKKEIPTPAIHLYPRPEFLIETEPESTLNAPAHQTAPTINAAVPHKATTAEDKNPAAETHEQPSVENRDQFAESFSPEGAKRTFRKLAASAETVMPNIDTCTFDSASQENVGTTSVPSPIAGPCNWPDLPGQNWTDFSQQQWPQLPNDYWSDTGNTDVPSVWLWRLQEQAKHRTLSTEEQRGTLWNG